MDHADYHALSVELDAATIAVAKARRALEYKRPPAHARAVYDAAVEKMRALNHARFEMEYATYKVVNIADLEPVAWFRAMHRK